MRPEPGCWVALDVGLQHTGIALGDGIDGQVTLRWIVDRHIVPYELDGAPSLNVEVEDGQAVLLPEALDAVKDCCRLVEEVGEVGGVTDTWSLVGDHRDEPVTAVLGTHVLDDVACDLVLGDEARTEALALLGKEAVKSFALQRTIDLIHAVADRGELDLPCGEELPVAVVPEGDEHAVILLRRLHEGGEIGHDEVLRSEALGALV